MLEYEDMIERHVMKHVYTCKMVIGLGYIWVHMS